MGANLSGFYDFMNLGTKDEDDGMKLLDDDDDDVRRDGMGGMVPVDLEIF